MDILFPFFESNKDIKNNKFDTYREYFGLTKEGSHNAVVDVRQTADVIARFMKWQRALAAKANYFKDSFKNESKS